MSTISPDCPEPNGARPSPSAGHPPRVERAIARYGAAVGATAIAFAVEVALDGHVRIAPLVAFYAAVIFAAWYGGLGPGIVALVLSGLAALALFPLSGRAPGIAPADEAIVLSAFAAVSLALAFVTAKARSSIHVAHRAKREAQAARAQADAAESVARAIVRGSGDAIVLKDRSGRYQLANAAVGRLIGRPTEDLIGHDDVEVFGPRVGQILMDRDRAVMDARETRTTEETIDDGRVHKVFLATKSPYLDERGEVRGVIGVARDITERDRFERQLQESEERQRLATEAAKVGTWLWEPKRDRLVWSAQCRSMHGLGPDDEVSYARLLSIVHPDDRAELERAVAEAIEHRSEYRREYRVVWPDRSVRWLSALGRAFYDEAGAPDRVMGVSIDVTADKEREHERAEWLAREQAARAEAQAATRAKDEFLAVLSHELRSPLQTMLGWAQVLKAHRTDARLLEKGLDTIERSVRTQARLIEDLLDVSRIVAGKLRLSLAPIDLSEVVQSAVEQTRAAAEAKAIGLEVRVEPASCSVLGDPDRLGQVVSNLLSNAVKFTPSGGRIEVRFERANGAARIIVSDTGRGISPELLPFIFDRFRQAESATVRRFGGLGLGLAIVRHLVELHGGIVQADSGGEGLGATFTVTLPLVSSKRKAVAFESRRWRTRSQVTAALEGVRVLVVDDDPDACELLERTLVDSGAEVHTATSASAALTELASYHPQVLVSDIGMPEEDGYALIRQLRERESIEGGHVPAIALTAFASAADRDQALAMGFEAHVAKPVSPADLTQAVARVVGASPA